MVDQSKTGAGGRKIALSDAKAGALRRAGIEPDVLHENLKGALATLDDREIDTLGKIRLKLTNNLSHELVSSALTDDVGVLVW